MPLLTPEQDFRERTLRHAGNPLTRLCYVAGLMRGKTYEHWGMQRVHGTAGASAIAAAHRSEMLSVLRSPVRELASQLEAGAAEPGVDTDIYVSEIAAQPLSPADAGPAYQAHLDAVVSALWELAHAAPKRRAA